MCMLLYVITASEPHPKPRLTGTVMLLRQLLWAAKFADLARTCRLLLKLPARMQQFELLSCWYILNATLFQTGACCYVDEHRKGHSQRTQKFAQTGSSSRPTVAERR